MVVVQRIISRREGHAHYLREGSAQIGFEVSGLVSCDNILAVSFGKYRDKTCLGRTWADSIHSNSYYIST